MTREEKIRACTHQTHDHDEQKGFLFELTLTATLLRGESGISSPLGVLVPPIKNKTENSQSMTARLKNI